MAPATQSVAGEGSESGSRGHAWGLVGGGVCLIVALAWSRGVTSFGAAAGDGSRSTAAAVQGRPGATAPTDTGRRAVQVDPSVAGTAAYQRGDYPAAMAHYREAALAHPDDAESLNNLAQVLTRLGRTDEAIPLYRRAIGLNPGGWAYQFNLARALGLTGDWPAAVAAYREAERLFPNDYATVFNLALALRRTGDEDGSVAALERAVRLAPGEASFVLELGHGYRRLGRSADATKAYQRYLDMAPDGPDATVVREHLAAPDPAVTPAARSRSAGPGPVEPGS